MSRKGLAGPDSRHERAVGGIVAGVDEAGRAPLAGPVVAAAVILPPNADENPHLARLNDSKVLSEPVRDQLFTVICASADYGIAAASAGEVDRRNIHHASLLAMDRAVRRLGLRPDHVLVDGKFVPPHLPCPATALVDGDAKSRAIAAASILAKVTRDRIMTRLAARFPGYGWDHNRGYPTDDHYLALLRLGPTRHHRTSFAPLPLLAGTQALGVSFRPAATPIDVQRLQVVRLRAGLAAVCDADGCHVGILRGRGWGRWRFFAVGYAADGAPTDGGGPLAQFHDREVGDADALVLRRIFQDTALPTTPPVA